MALLSIDLGGTKLAFAIFSFEGEMLSHERVLLNNRKGKEISALITNSINLSKTLADKRGLSIDAIGISIPGVFNREQGTVWAPNIAGWEQYPLLQEIRASNPQIPASIESDRTCYIQGELWQGTAVGCTDAIYLSVGTGIGAGILTNGAILRGSTDIAGAIGWMAVPKLIRERTGAGCLEDFASGKGIVKMANQLLMEVNSDSSELSNRHDSLTAQDVFKAYYNNDIVAEKVVQHCIALWGMTVANLVSIFNPQKIILGGGVFGPAIPLIPAIKEEALKWAQPLSARRYSLESSALGSNAGLYGAAFLALQHLRS